MFAGRLMGLDKTFAIISGLVQGMQIYLNKKAVDPSLFQVFKSLDQVILSEVKRYSNENQ